MTTLPDSDGYVAGQRDRALVLDLLARHHAACLTVGRAGLDAHEALTLPTDTFDHALTELVFDGYARDAGGFHVITSAGLAAHASARALLADIAATVDFDRILGDPEPALSNS